MFHLFLHALMSFGRSRSRKGRVADWCGLCRKVGPFHLVQIKTGNGTVVGFEVECSGCRARQPADLARYSGLARWGSRDLAQLVERTQPDLAARYHGQLRHTLRLAKGELGVEERGEMARESLAAAARWSTVSWRLLDMDLPILVGVLVLVGGPIAAGIFGIGAPRTGTVAAALAGLGLGLMLVGQATLRGRFIRRKVLPPLRRSLAALDLRERDLQAVLDEFPPSTARALFPYGPPDQVDFGPGADPGEAARLEELLAGVDRVDADFGKGQAVRAALLEIDRRFGDRMNHIHVDGPVLVSALVAFGLFAGPCWLGGDPDRILAVCGAGAVALVVSIVLLATSGRRRLRRRPDPEILEILARVDPSVDELRRALEYLGHVGYGRTCKVLDARSLRAALDRR